MNINSKLNKTTAVIVPIMLLALYSLAFFGFGLEHTPTLKAAYAFGFLSAALFCFGNLYFILTKSGYPWLAAIPMTLWRYVITAALLSTAFVIADRTVFVLSGIPVLFFIAAQIIALAFFLLMLLLMHTGKAYIAELDEKVAESASFIRSLSPTLAVLQRKAPAETVKDIMTLADAIRYSDPVSHLDVEVQEQDIQAGVRRLEVAVSNGDADAIRRICADTTVIVKERAERVRFLKQKH